MWVFAWKPIFSACSSSKAPILYNIIIIFLFTADADEEIDEGPIVETNYVKEKGEEYLGQVHYTVMH